MLIASPRFTLLSMLAAAALVFGSGWQLARRSSDKHLPPDRAVLREFATGLQRELLRLEALFQTDLRDLAGKTARANGAALQASCSSLYGIVQYSRLTASGVGDDHFVIQPAPGRTPPIPILAGARLPFANPARTLLLPPEDASPAGDLPDFGWFVPADPDYWIIWQRLDAENVQAFLIDRAQIVERVDFYLRQWLEKSFAPVRAARGLERIETPGGQSLAGLSAAPDSRSPDLILPLVCRFGDWQIVAWDRVARQTFYDPATLALTSTIAAVLAILGFILYFQQRRAARQAEQRVSFVNRVSHELGTPLTNILLNLDLLEDEQTEASDPHRQRLRLVSEEARRLSRLVCNVLTFSRHERGRLKLNPAPAVPDEIIASILRQFQPALERRGILTEWHGAAAQPISLDSDAFAQIIANLISNVEKYAAEGKRLTIHSHHTKDTLIVRVADCGPGVPTSHAARIFDAFERVDSRVNEGSSGAGLGLTIARELAELMNGQLRLLASEHGALFELGLPVEQKTP